MGSHLNEEPMERNDVDDQPTPIVKLSQAYEHAQLLPIIVVEHPSEFLVIDMMNMQSFINKLNKLPIFKINKHHQKTINSYSLSV